MCKASLEAKKVVKAVKGAMYGIGTGPLILAAIHPHGEDPKECVACTQTGDVLTLVNIPPDLQQQLGISNQKVVSFVQTDHNMQDMLKIDGKIYSLSMFANKGIGVYFGELENLDKTFVDQGELELPQRTTARRRTLVPQDG